MKVKGTRVRVALYARCSTNGKGKTSNKRQDPEVQLRPLRAAAKQRGWKVVGEFIDRGVSGSRDRRPNLDRMMKLVRDRAADVVLTWALDRLGRSLAHLIALVEDFSEHEVDLVCLTQPIDTTSPAGRLLFQLLACFAEFERALIVERVRAGLDRARAAGKRLGRPPRATPQQVERALALRAHGISWRRVAMSVGLPQTTVREAVGAARGNPVGPRRRGTHARRRAG